jgi:hypothetical protein
MPFQTEEELEAALKAEEPEEPEDAREGEVHCACGETVRIEPGVISHCDCGRAYDERGVCVADEDGAVHVDRLPPTSLAVVQGGEPEQGTLDADYTDANFMVEPTLETTLKTAKTSELDQMELRDEITLKVKCVLVHHGSEVKGASTINVQKLEVRHIEVMAEEDEVADE